MAKTIVIPSDPSQLKAMKGNIEEAVNALTRAASERDLVKEIVSKMSEDFEIPKATLNKMIRIAFKQSLDEEVTKLQDIEELMEKVGV